MSLSRYLTDLSVPHLVIAAEDIPAMISVGGRDVPTRNSEGRLIHPTLRGVENFWRWFGDSKLVDEQGRPRVFLHGTKSDFHTFDHVTDEERISGIDPTAQLGFHFTDIPAVADKFASGLYTRKWDKEGGSVFPVYLRASSVLKVTETEIHNAMSSYDLSRTSSVQHAVSQYAYENDEDEDAVWEQYDNEVFRSGINKLALDLERTADDPDFELPREMSDKYKAQVVAQGHDCIEYKNEVEGGISWIVFEPNQIKSALGNKGEFSSDSAVTASFEATATNEDTKIYYKLRILAQAIVKTLKSWSLTSKGPKEEFFLEELPWASSGAVIPLRKMLGDKLNRLGADVQAVLDGTTVVLQAGRPMKGGRYEENAVFGLSSRALASVIEHKYLMLPFFGGKPSDFNQRMESILTHELRHCYDAMALGHTLTNTNNLSVENGDYYTDPYEQNAFTEQIKLAVEHWLENKLRRLKQDRPGAGQVNRYTDEYEVSPHRIETIHTLRKEIASAFESPKSFLVWLSSNRESLLTPYASALKSFLEHQTSDAGKKQALKSVLVNVYTDLKARYRNVLPEIATASEDYQDDTEYNDDHKELTHLGLIFGQPSAYNKGIKVVYKGHTLTIEPSQLEVIVRPAVSSRRGRAYVPAKVDYVPSYLIKSTKSANIRKEEAEQWLRGLKAEWDKD